MQQKFIKNIFYLFLPLLSGSLIGLIISPFMDYGMLNKPVLSPPGFLFPLLWSILYILLGVSFYLYKKDNKKDIALEKYYYISLIVNLLWSIFFFVFKLRYFTILWTFILLYLVVKLLLKYFEVNKISFYLNIPYLIWLIFATYLTIGVYILN